MQSKKLTTLKNYQKRLKKLLEKYKELKDVFIFGSIVKGKDITSDVDLALFFKDTPPKNLVNILREEIKKIIKDVDIGIVNVYSPLWLVIMREGFSISKNKFIYELYKVKPIILYKYSLKKLNPVQKVQFTRGLDAMIKSTEGIKLTRSIVLIPLKNKIKFDEFLESWNMFYETKAYELMPILRKEEL